MGQSPQGQLSGFKYIWKQVHGLFPRCCSHYRLLPSLLFTKTTAAGTTHCGGKQALFCLTSGPGK